MKKQIRNILFTFDYELFLGARSGTPEKCILRPTADLLELFSKYEIGQAVFFVDTTYLLKLTESEEDIFKIHFSEIRKQLQQIITQGHYIFPHIHPHWLDALKHTESEQWDLSNHSKYRFHKLSKVQQQDIFDKSVSLLHDIITPVRPDYKINGYRAGGWSIQPFSDFKELFDKHDITFDFSVLPGFKNLSDAQYFDFFKIKDYKKIYRFSEAVDVIDEKGKYKEFCISTIKLTKMQMLTNKLWLKYLWETGNHSIGDGLSVNFRENKTNSGLKKEQSDKMVSIELLNRMMMPVYKKYLEENEYMHFISHPKMLSRHNLKTFETFLIHIKETYDLNFDFMKM